MSRLRKITENDILDAAERVVVREGAAGLSIDAVAREAGVSKSRVVYDHKTKAELLRALVERRISAEKLHIESCVREKADTAHPEFYGRLASAGQSFDEDEKAVALAICASMSSEEAVQEIMRDWLQKELAAMETGPRGRAARVAYLALYGYFTAEIFKFHDWSDEERRDILDDIGKVFTSFPER